MLDRRKRVYSFWNKSVPQLSLHYKQYKIVEARRLTPIVMRQLGSRLVVIDELTRDLEHCGDLIPARLLRTCAFRKDVTPEPKAPAVAEIFGSVAPEAAKPEPEPKPEPKPEPAPEPTPEPEAAPEPVVEPEPAAPEAVEAPAEEEAPKPTRKKTTRRSSKKATTKKASTKKAEAPAEEPKAEDLNPFADSE